MLLALQQKFYAFRFAQEHARHLVSRNVLRHVQQIVAHNVLQHALRHANHRAVQVVGVCVPVAAQQIL